MNLKKAAQFPNTTVTRSVRKFDEKNGNIYEALAIISKRANQLSVQVKEELNKKLEDFASYTDTLDEVYENREQIEISRYFERLPKPTLMAVQEWLDNEIYYRNPEEEEKSI
jgi:DNA-directed RNA polymerase subunit K/omega